MLNTSLVSLIIIIQLSLSSPPPPISCHDQGLIHSLDQRDILRLHSTFSLFQLSLSSNKDADSSLSYLLKGNVSIVLTVTVTDCVGAPLYYSTTVTDCVGTTVL